MACGVPSRTSAIDDCVETLTSAGSCASASSSGKLAPLSECVAEPGVLEASREVMYACELVESPELAKRCSFLSPAPFEGEGGGAGAG